MRSRLAPLALAVALTGSLLVATPVAGAADAVLAVSPITLRVMTFNIRYGAFYSTVRAVRKAIRVADADVVGLQEPFGKTRKIARMLGWYSAPRLHTISRYPIVQPPGSVGRWGYLLLGGGRVVAIANNHSPSTPYGPDLVRAGVPKWKVLRTERRRRLPWQQPFLDALAPLIAGGEPVFFTGDFNSPSWRDWTPEVVRAVGWLPRKVVARGPRYPIRWPVSTVIEAAGLRDSYREVHPDPIETLGITWTSGHPNVTKWDVLDRIDFIWTAGPTTTLSSKIVGDVSKYTDIVSLPWPSDHRAVVSRFRVTPAIAPTFAAPYDVRAFAGRDFTAAFHAPAGPGRTIGIWTRDDDPTSDPALVSADLGNSVVNGTEPLSTDGIAPGDYALVLLDGGSVLSRVIVTVVDPQAAPTISLSKTHYATGEPIRVTWTGDPGNRFDWLSVNRARSDPASSKLWEWRYIGARINGTGAIGPSAVGAWPLPAGHYRVSLCIDDDYRCIATTSTFTVDP